MKKILLFLFLLTLISSSIGQAKYHRAKIFYTNSKDLVILANQGITIDHGTHKKDVFIESDFSEDELATAKILGFNTEIVIKDVVNHYKNQSKNQNKNQSCIKTITFPIPSNYNNGTMGGFLTYNEMLLELEQMASLYPNLISLKDTIGNFLTAEGRPIYWVKISDNPTINESEPEMLYTAIHHAREPASLQQTIFYMWYLLENYAINDEVKSIIDNTQLFFIPCLNPDGYIYNETTEPNGGGLWRKNRRDNLDGEYGVDLNRNYNYGWGGAGTSANTNSDIYKGTNAFSEVETQAIKWFCEQHNFKLALNSHSYGNLLLYPFGYATGQFTADDAYYKAFSEVMVEQNNYINQISSALYEASGDSDDWMYGETSTHAKILALTPEVGNSFWPTEADIIPLCEQMVHHNQTAAKLLLNYAKTIDNEKSSSISAKNGYLNYKIQCLGLQNPGNFTISIQPISQNIITIGNPKNHNGMFLLQTDTDSISYSLNQNTQEGEEVIYVITTNNGLYESNDTIYKIYGNAQPILSDNGDNTSNWLSNGDWGTTNQEFYSPSNSFTDSPNGVYQNSSTSYFQLTNEVSLTNVLSATVSFYAKWSVETEWDYVQFEVSTDNGLSWVPQCGKFTKKGNENQAEGEPLYDGFQNTWVKEEINLKDYIDQSILARFKLVTDQAVREDGFYFDDFNINIIYASNGIDELSYDEYFLSQNSPNPSNGNTTIYYQVSKNTLKNQLILINQLGEVIKKELLTTPKGKVDLNTKDLPSGIYFYYISNNEKYSIVRKLSIIN